MEDELFEHALRGPLLNLHFLAALAIPETVLEMKKLASYIRVYRGWQTVWA